MHLDTYDISKRAHICWPRDRQSVCWRSYALAFLTHVIFSSSLSIIHSLRQRRKGEPRAFFSVSVTHTRFQTLTQMYLSSGRYIPLTHFHDALEFIQCCAVSQECDIQKSPPLGKIATACPFCVSP